MNKEQVIKAVKFEGDADFKINGTIIPFESIVETFFNKIWRTAMVNKNRRESENGGLKTIISKALTAGIVSTDEALQIILLGDKVKAKALAEKLAPSEKTDEPNEEDVNQAIALVMSGGGLNVSQ